MPAPIEPVRDGLPVEFLGRVINRLIREVNRWNRATTDGRIGFSNGAGGPRWSLDDDGGGGLILCRIGAGGMTARVGGTLGTGDVTRYNTDGLTVTLAAAPETGTNPYYATIPGDFDGWFTEHGGKLSLVTRACSDG